MVADVMSSLSRCALLTAATLAIGVALIANARANDSATFHVLFNDPPTEQDIARLRTINPHVTAAQRDCQPGRVTPSLNGVGKAIVVITRPCTISAPSQETEPTFPVTLIFAGADIAVTERDAARRLSNAVLINETSLDPIGAFAAVVAEGTPTDARLAFVGDRTQLARTLRTRAHTLSAANQKAIAFNGDFQAGARDYAATARAILATNPTDVAIAAFPAEAAILARELKALQPTIRIHGSYLLAQPAFATQAGSAADGITVALPKARRANETDNGRELRVLHAAIEMASQAVAKAPNREPATLSAILRLNTAQTILGPLTFDADGQSSLKPYQIARWRGGKLIDE
jgi:hypothetical protein